jgi:hypothetical protein
MRRRNSQICVNISNTIAVILGILFVVGVVGAVQTLQFVRKAVRVRAKVVDVLDATVSNPDTSSQSSPTSRFVTQFDGFDIALWPARRST